MWFCGFPSSCQVNFLFCFMPFLFKPSIFLLLLLRWNMHSSPPIHNILFFFLVFFFSLPTFHYIQDDNFFPFLFPDSLSFAFNSLSRCEIVSLVLLLSKFFGKGGKHKNNRPDGIILLDPPQHTARLVDSLYSVRINNIHTHTKWLKKKEKSGSRNTLKKKKPPHATI